MSVSIIQVMFYSITIFHESYFSEKVYRDSMMHACQWKEDLGCTHGELARVFFQDLTSNIAFKASTFSNLSVCILFRTFCMCLLGF